MRIPVDPADPQGNLPRQMEICEARPDWKKKTKPTPRPRPKPVGGDGEGESPQVRAMMLLITRLYEYILFFQDSRDLVGDSSKLPVPGLLLT